MEIPICLDKRSYLYECQNQTFKCGKCLGGLCLLCYSYCEYCDLILCYNCYDNDNGYCYKNWLKQVKNITCQIFNKYTFLEINLKDYILSYINNGF